MALTRQASRRVVNAVGGVILFILMIWTIAPLYWMVITSLKSNAEIYSSSATLWPQAPTLDNYFTLFQSTNFPLYFRNSMIVALATVVLSLIISALAAYALTRLRFRGRRLMAQGLVYTYLMPSSLLFIPLLIIIRNVGLQNSMEGLVLSYLGFTVPFCTWLLMGYFVSIPIELEESAMVDGCSRIGVLWRIVLPLTLPALAIVAFFSFTLSWNEFIYASVLVTDANVRTIPTGIPDFVVADTFFWGPMMASTLISTLPPLIVYFVFQRFLISGLTLGAVKG
jgi:multiple sugar transport system permease protein